MPQDDLGLVRNDIVSVERTSGTGQPGSVDTYTITMRSGATFTFTITNGTNGGTGGVEKHEFSTVSDFTDWYIAASTDLSRIISIAYFDADYNSMLCFLDNSGATTKLYKMLPNGTMQELTALSSGEKIVAFYKIDESTTIDTELNENSVNPVQNKAIVAGLKAEADVLDSKIKETVSYFEKSNGNIFNKFDYLKTTGLYLNASLQYITYASSLILSIKVDGVSGDTFSVNHFVSFSLTNNGIKLYTSNNLPSSDASAIEASENVNQSLKRGFITLTSNATYVNLQYLFDDVNQMKANIQKIVDGLVVRKSTSYASEYIGYYLTVEETKENLVPKTRKIVGLGLSNDISEEQLNNATGTNKIKEKLDEVTSYFEPSGINLFNKFDCLKEAGIYLNASYQYIAYASSFILTFKINGLNGDKFAFNNFNSDFVDLTISGMKVFSSNTVPAIGQSIVQEFSSAYLNATLKRGTITLTSDATYLNIQYLFASESDMNNYIDKMISGLMLVKGANFAENYHNYYNSILESSPNNWKGKNIWWCGTSIPAGMDNAIGSPSNGKSYPILVGELLGASVSNKSIGSSMARANVRTGDFVNGLSYNITLAMTQTQEEKQYMINNWDTIRQALSDPNTYETLDGISSQVIASSFDTILMPYLDGTLPMPDLFVIDHGHNDFKTQYSLPNGNPDIGLEPTYENIQNGVLAEDTYMTENNYYNLKRYFGDLSKIPSWRLNDFVASVNRNCFKGAINFLCTLILHYNPRARIVFIGNLDNWQRPGVVEAQEDNAKSWEFPLIKMYEYTGFSGHWIPGTYNYWGENAEYDLRVKDIYCKDTVHPHSDTTGQAITLYSKVIADKLEHIAV